MKVVIFCGSSILPHSRSCSITPWGRTIERVLGTGSVWSMCQPSLVGTVLEQAAVSSAKTEDGGVLEQAAVSSAKTEDGGVLALCWSRQQCPVLRRKMAVCCCHSRLWIGPFSLPETG